MTLADAGPMEGSLAVGIIAPITPGASGSPPLLRLHDRLQEVLDRGQLALHQRLLFAQLLHLALQRGDLLGRPLLAGRRRQRDDGQKGDGGESYQHLREL